MSEMVSYRTFKIAPQFYRQNQNQEVDFFRASTIAVPLRAMATRRTTSGSGRISSCQKRRLFSGRFGQPPVHDTRDREGCSSGHNPKRKILIWAAGRILSLGGCSCPSHVKGVAPVEPPSTNRVKAVRLWTSCEDSSATATR